MNSGPANSQQSGQRQLRTAVVAGITGFILTLVVCQLWLVTATVNAFLGGDDSLVLPAFVASAVGLVLNLGLLRYLFALGDR